MFHRWRTLQGLFSGTTTSSGQRVYFPVRCWRTPQGLLCGTTTSSGRRVYFPARCQTRRSTALRTGSGTVGWCVLLPSWKNFDCIRCPLGWMPFCLCSSPAGGFLLQICHSWKCTRTFFASCGGMMEGVLEFWISQTIPRATFWTAETWKAREGRMEWGGVKVRRAIPNLLWR